MKKPKLNFTKVYYVPGWADTIQEGVAAELEYRENFSTRNAFLFVGEDGKWKMISPSEIHLQHAHAVNALERERRNHKEYLERMVREYQEKLSKL
jgi:hypothetical protein